MNKAHEVLRHTTVILSLMFIVFLILDQFNPMMNFIDNNISRWLLAALCASGIGQSVTGWLGGFPVAPRTPFGRSPLEGGKPDEK